MSAPEFRSLAQQLRSLLHDDNSCGAVDREQKMASLTAELSELSFPLRDVSTDEISPVVVDLVLHVGATSDQLVQNVAQLVTALVTKHPTQLRPQDAEECVRRLLQLLRSAADWLRSSILRTLGAILYEPQVLDVRTEEDIARALLPLARRGSASSEAQRHAIACLSNLLAHGEAQAGTAGSGAGSTPAATRKKDRAKRGVLAHASEFLEIVMEHLRHIMVSEAALLNRARFAGTCLRAAQSCIQADPVAADFFADDVFESVKRAIYVGHSGAVFGVNAGFASAALAVAGGSSTRRRSTSATWSSTSADFAARDQSTHSGSAGNSARDSTACDAVPGDNPSAESGSSSGAPAAASDRPRQGRSGSLWLAPKPSPGASQSVRASQSRNSSGSDMSDSEGEWGERERSVPRLRAAGLHALAAIARACPKRSFIHWPSFLPVDGGTDTRPYTPSLFTVLLYDSSGKCRAGAATSATALLERSRPLLAVAETPRVGRRGTTYLSFAERLAMMVCETHTALAQATRNERQTSVLLAVLKCAATAVGVAPYARLPATLPATLSAPLASLASATEGSASGPTVRAAAPARAAAFACLAAVIERRLDPQHPGAAEFASALQRDADRASEATEGAPGAFAGADDPAGGDAGVCVAVRGAMRSAEDDQAPPAVRAEALRCAGAVALLAQHGTAARVTVARLGARRLAPLARRLVAQDADAAVRAAAARALDAAVTAVAGHSDARDEYTDDVAALYHTVLHDLVPEMLSDSNSNVRVCALTCAGAIPAALAGVGAGALVAWARRGAKDAQHAVRAAAPRLFAAACTVDSGTEMPEGELWETSLDELIDLSRDGNVTVRMRAVGALADTLSLEAAGTILGPAMLERAARGALVAANDNDRVRAGALRCIGAIATLFPFDAQPALLAPCVDALRAGLEGKESSNVAAKRRWNAGFAMSRVFANESVRDLLATEPHWLAGVLRRLADASEMDANFKVRINALGALVMLPTREQFGMAFLSVVEVLSRCYARGATAKGASEARYLPQLERATRAALVHVLSLISWDDAASPRGRSLLREHAESYLHALMDASTAESPGTDEAPSHESAYEQGDAQTAFRVLNQIFAENPGLCSETVERLYARYVSGGL